MAANSQSPASERSVIAAAFAAIALFVVAWTLLHVGFYKHKQVIDTPVYQRYGNAIADGKVPYRDFAVEYPPGALPMFALPGLAEPGKNQQVSAGFRRAFETLMWMCGAVALLAMAVVLRVLRRSDLNVWAALCFAAVAPLLLGSVILSRFDLWPAAICVAALAALVSNRLRLGHALLGLGITAKLFPVVFVPLGVAYVWKRAGRREALICLALLAGVVGAIFLPFVVLSPGGVWDSLSVQLSRPLQVESLGASLLLVGHHVFGFGLAGETSHGSQNVAGSAAGVLAVATTFCRSACSVGSGRRSPVAVATARRWFVRPRRPLRVRRARQGAVAAVPDLADPDRPARARTSWLVGERPSGGGARPDAGVVPVPLLQAGAPLRSRSLVGLARTRPCARRAHGVAGIHATA